MPSLLVYEDLPYQTHADLHAQGKPSRRHLLNLKYQNLGTTRAQCLDSIAGLPRVDLRCFGCAPLFS